MGLCAQSSIAGARVTFLIWAGPQLEPKLQPQNKRKGAREMLVCSYISCIYFSQGRIPGQQTLWKEGFLWFMFRQLLCFVLFRILPFFHSSSATHIWKALHANSWSLDKKWSCTGFSLPVQSV